MRRLARTLAALIVLAAAPGRAQDATTGSLDGTTRDPAGVSLPGVLIEVRSPSLPGARRTSSDAGGRFRVPALPPGLYHVAATLGGFSRIEEAGVRVGLGETATVRLTMRIEIAARVAATAEPPLLDTTTAADGQNVREDVVRMLPVGRNYADILKMSPGVGTDNAETQGRAIPFAIYGATSLENQYLVDGANTTNVVKGMQGKTIPNEFVEELQIRTSGFEAEYSGALGGIVNVVTKSGGNAFHGDVFGYFGSKGLTAANVATGATDAFFVERTSEDRRDYGLDVGGPFAKDRLWFFGAYNRVDLDQDQLVLPGSNSPNQGVNFPLDFSQNSFAGKLTWRAGESTTLFGTIFGDPERREGALRNYNATTPVTQEGIRQMGATDASFGATQLLGMRGLLNARYAYHGDRYELAGKADGIRLRDTTVTPPLVSGGFGGIDGPTENYESTRHAGRLDGTLFAGDHEIKAGAGYERNVTDAHTYVTGGQSVTKRFCPTAGPSRCPAGVTAYYEHNFPTSSVTDPVGGLLPDGFSVSPTTERLGLFVQDSFRPVRSLTINAGLRWDEDRVRDSAGDTIFTLSGQWQPRLGIAWDFRGDGANRISVSIGRFAYALPTFLSVGAYGSQIFAFTYNFSPTDPAQDPRAPFPTIVNGGLRAEPVQENLKGIYQDELTLGITRALDPTLVIGARYTHRSLGRTIEDRCDLDPAYPEARGSPCVIINPGSDSPFATGAGIHGCTGQDYLGTGGNPPESQCSGPAVYPAGAIPDATRRYDALELVARKQTATLFLQASYVLSRLRGNYDGAASNSFGTSVVSGTRQAQSGPSWNQDFDLPALLVNADGRLFLDRPHAFRLDAAWTAPFGVTAGLQWFLRSGAPISRRVTYDATFGYSVFVTERGSEGRQAWDQEVNLQVQYAFHAGASTITLLAQGFNLLNRQTVLDTDQLATIRPPVFPNAANPDYGKATSRRDPRSLRFGARVSF